MTLDAAKLVLQGIKDALDVIPVKAGPRIVTLTASRETALAVLEPPATSWMRSVLAGCRADTWISIRDIGLAGTDVSYGQRFRRVSMCPASRTSAPSSGAR